jgi:hypothetical protein
MTFPPAFFPSVFLSINRDICCTVSMADMASQDVDEFDVARFSAFRELCSKLAKPTGPGEGVGLYVANDLVEIKESADGSTVDVTMYADDTAEIWIDDGRETYRIAMVKTMASSS